eukprot:4467997-Amphidinium_carterae.1
MVTGQKTCIAGVSCTEALIEHPEHAQKLTCQLVSQDIWNKCYPVQHMNRAQRKARCLRGQDHLTIEEQQPHVANPEDALTVRPALRDGQSATRLGAKLAVIGFECAATANTFNHSSTYRLALQTATEPKAQNRNEKV